MARANRNLSGKRLVISVAVFMSLISAEAFTQDETETCPCFSYEEVDSIFQRGEQIAGEGTSNCIAEDYDVECSAEVTVLDKNYEAIAQARVKWYDFDPGRCDYIDINGNPGVERHVAWPYPAPEATARACFNIISSVIAKSDTSGRCTTFP